jgi:hypothetical protein
MDEIEKSYCQRCDYNTNHKVLHKESIRSDYEEGFDYAVEYMILKCMGCERISFREVFINLEVSYPDQDGDWQPEITVTTYPEELKVKKKLENTFELPEKIKLIYKEAINAYNANCLILTGVAFRAVIEAICIEEKISGSNLEKKINNLVKQKLITEKEANRLHSIRFMGNDSVHEMKVPKKRGLETVLNIINHLLNNLYLIDTDSHGVLETIIVKFQDFEMLLNKCIRKFNPGDEIPLAKILSKDVRRLNGRIADYEHELIEKINNGEYKKLEIGKVDSYGNDSTQRQHFKIK